MPVRPHDGRRLLPVSGLLFALICLSSVSCDRRSQAREPADNLPTTAVTRRNLAPNLLVDSDEDGIPDGAEMRTAGDRESFRRWFTAIAEAQFYRVSDGWSAEQQDCAGLVRFAWREALRPHDRTWMKTVGGINEPVAPDLTVSRLIDFPPGGKLFRTAFGAFREGDLKDGTFSEFADARTLKNYNVNFVGRERREVRPGDLLFFHQPWMQSFPFHVMIFLGEAREAGEGASDWVVYHTGAGSGAGSGVRLSARPSPSPDGNGVVTERGTIKKVRLSVLDHHPNTRWRPVIDNANFLGYYRLKILD